MGIAQRGSIVGLTVGNFAGSIAVHIMDMDTPGRLDMYGRRGMCMEVAIFVLCGTRMDIGISVMRGMCVESGLSVLFGTCVPSAMFGTSGRYVT